MSLTYLAYERFVDVFVFVLHICLYYQLETDKFTEMFWQVHLDIQIHSIIIQLVKINLWLPMILQNCLDNIVFQKKNSILNSMNLSRCLINDMNLKSLIRKEVLHKLKVKRLGNPLHTEGLPVVLQWSFVALYLHIEDSRCYATKSLIIFLVRNWWFRQMQYSKDLIVLSSFQVVIKNSV